MRWRRLSLPLCHPVGTTPRRARVPCKGKDNLKIFSLPVARSVARDFRESRAREKLARRQGNLVMSAATITVSPVVGSETRET